MKFSEEYFRLLNEYAKSGKSLKMQIHYVISKFDAFKKSVQSLESNPSLDQEKILQLKGSIEEIDTVILELDSDLYKSFKNKYLDK